ncbi:hypothetical protein [Aquabacterium humicola]|uniref:hypothetical protein n=1 Tax=Aquabacterium humicola TaxID=3237377 RepID=UPI0025436F39|nr:hypothetical protein [Rubrivivax pictus]
MFETRPARAAGWRAFVRAACVVATLALGGCGSFYVDSGTPEVQASQYRKPAQAKPVQLMFEFQTKGAPNARATEMLKAQISEQVKTSGLFADVAEQPVPGGAMLSIVLNNVPLTDDAFTKGFVTGLTFGLAGNQVSDGYVCTAKYLGEGQAQPIVKSARHAIHTTVGAAAAPANAVKADSIEAAVRTMTRQIVSTTLNELSQEIAK